MTPANATPDTPSHPAAKSPTPAGSAQDLAAALSLVRGLLQSGALDAGVLGVPTPAPVSGPQEGSRFVPGDRITIRELYRKAEQGCSVNTRRTYGTYMRLLSEGWPAAAAAEDKLFDGFGDRWADELLPSDLRQALAFVEQRALMRAHWRADSRHRAERTARTSDASGAKYTAVGAWRRMFKVAVQDRHLTKAYDPSQDVDKPKRSDGTRQALEQPQFDELVAFVAGSGDDPELDSMIIDTIVIAGARREGMLNLTLGGIDRVECTLRLDEKFGKVVHQPVPDWFAHELHAFAVARGAGHPDDAVFRKRASGKRPAAPITDRRFDHLFQRVQAAFTWADREQVSAHTLRHHAIAQVERISSKAVSLKFARHEPEDANDRYSKATPKEVAAAVVRLHGGDHPWLHRDRRHVRD